jgi:hypothetical protein
MQFYRMVTDSSPYSNPMVTSPTERMSLCESQNLHETYDNVTFHPGVDFHLYFEIQLDLDLQAAVLLAHLGRPVGNARLVHGDHASVAAVASRRDGLGLLELIFVIVVVQVLLLRRWLALLERQFSRLLGAADGTGGRLGSRGFLDVRDVVLPMGRNIS